MKKFLLSIFTLLGILFWDFTQLSAQSIEPYFLQDRGTGVASSMFGTYINKGEFVVYPFFEYYNDRNAEYKPLEFGFGLNQDFRGRYRGKEGLIFLGYGITENLIIEIEAAYISATQFKANNDPSAMPSRLKESGVGDVESQIRWRWNKETNRTPEFFSYFETVYPLQKNKILIGTQNWELKLGAGLIKGFKWGTMTFRTATEYDAGEQKLELGEYAVEYLNRISKVFRFYVGFEGTQDELELISDLQFHLTNYLFIRLNNSFGVTSKATDYAPEVGILFHF